MPEQAASPGEANGTKEPRRTLTVSLPESTVLRLEEAYWRLRRQKAQIVADAIEAYCQAHLPAAGGTGA